MPRAGRSVEHAHPEKMRRHEKEITAFSEIEAIIRREKICRLALVDNNRPYLVPLSYGYADRTLYFHSATQGRKIDILKANPQVCFEIESRVEVVTAPTPCRWGMRFETVIGEGRAQFIRDPQEKKEALQAIINQYGAPAITAVEEKAMAGLALFKIRIEQVCGKKSGL